MPDGVRASNGPEQVVVHRLRQKIEDRSAQVVVIGVGYVGLPLVVELARAGFRVTGYDKDREKIRLLATGESYIGDIPSGVLKPLVDTGRLRASFDPDVLGSADAIIVCVPTPLNKSKAQDMRFIASASDEIAEHQHADMLIVLESTTYPGTTREVLLPRLSQGKYALGEDAFIAFSPERVDPGNTRFHTRNTPKVIGGMTPACLEIPRALYGTIIDTLVPVSSTDAAEMVKLLENTFRAVNIGLVNEVALMSRRLQEGRGRSPRVSGVRHPPRAPLAGGRGRLRGPPGAGCGGARARVAEREHRVDYGRYDAGGDRDGPLRRRLRADAAGGEDHRRHARRAPPRGRGQEQGSAALRGPSVE
jgi:hypothetical protein